LKSGRFVLKKPEKVFEFHLNQSEFLILFHDINEEEENVVRARSIDTAFLHTCTSASLALLPHQLSYCCWHFVYVRYTTRRWRLRRARVRTYINLQHVICRQQAISHQYLLTTCRRLVDAITRRVLLCASNNFTPSCRFKHTK